LSCDQAGPAAAARHSAHASLAAAPRLRLAGDIRDDPAGPPVAHCRSAWATTLRTSFAE
jgi:hypothetical protein